MSSAGTTSPKKKEASERTTDVPYRVPMSETLEGSIYSDPPNTWLRLMPIKEDDITWGQIFRGEAQAPVSEQLPDDLEAHPFQGSTFVPLEPGYMDSFFGENSTCLCLGTVMDDVPNDGNLTPIAISDDRSVAIIRCPTL
ncbi:hypothetical protein FOZ61_004210 [Perkinsus olseni]|uniref:Uncharacterized protein n=1 Tax=Perkinsus olseni TaxID=32597 RepID=A0A7J6LLY1_PEROL|nr:hypothetical protein FOZ61_004210 [Perkinsus olseni]